MSENFALEYQEFSIDGHWEHVDSPEVAGSVVIQALQWYAEDDDRWRTDISWKRIPASEHMRRIAESNQEAEAEAGESQGSIIGGAIKVFLKTFLHEIGK